MHMMGAKVSATLPPLEHQCPLKSTCSGLEQAVRKKVVELISPVGMYFLLLLLSVEDHLESRTSSSWVSYIVLLNRQAV